MAFRIFKRLAELLDVDTSGVADGDALVYDDATGTWIPGAGGGGGGAPTDADYLVGTANGSLSSEIVVGTSPGGELGGTWASPTVDATHSGSSHAAVQAAAEATAAAALTTHIADTTAIHGIADTSALALTANHPSNATFNDHSARHEDGGADEISLTGLSGTPAALTTHEADTTNIHGIADTSALLDTGDIGVSVQAFDADLSTYAGISPSANVQSVLGAADFAAIRTLLGLVIGTNVQAFDTDLTTWAGLTPSANAQSLVTAANYAAMRALLDLEAGTDFPALATFEDHSARHENGGADEISIAGLDGTPTELTNHLSDATDAHDASAISLADAGGNTTETEVEGAIAELYDLVAAAGGGTDLGYARSFLMGGY